MSNVNGQATTNHETASALAIAPPREEPAVQLGQPPTAYERQLEPAGFGDAMKLCESIARSGICGVQNPDDALVRLMTGRSLGLTAMQSLRGIYVVKGRPALDASLMMALCLRHPECERFEFVESTETKAVLAVKRRGRSEQLVVWTIEDARRAELVKDDSNWKKYPKQMLRARCKADGARLEFSDVLFGLYSVEEMHDGVIVTTGETVTGADLKAEGRATEAEQLARIEADKAAQVKLRDEILEQLKSASSADDKRAFVKRMRDLDPKALSAEYHADIKAAFEAKYPPKNAAAPAKPAEAPAPEPPPAREPGVD